MSENEGHLNREVRKVLDEFLDGKFSPTRQPFEVVCDETNNSQDSVDQNVVNATIKFDLCMCTVLFGKTAGELREMGYLGESGEGIPDCAVLGPGGFEWITLDLTLTPGDAKVPKPDWTDCTCVTSCADDPATACSLSGQMHVHPKHDDLFGPCPVHPDAPGDL